MITPQDAITERLDRIIPVGSPKRNAVSEFACTFNSTTLGVTAKFTVRDRSSVVAFNLKRSSTLDIGSAVLLQTWQAIAVADDDTLSFDDNDPAMRSEANLSYWVECVASNPANTTQIGPQTVVKGASTLPPGAITQFDASHEAAGGGVVQVSVSFTADSRTASVKILASGYRGVAGFVTVAQVTLSPSRFAMSATGETVVLKAIAVSALGVDVATGPTVTIVLTAGATVPAQIQGVSVAALPTGNQVSFSGGAETNLTSYQVWSGLQGAGFGAATNIGSVAPTGAGAYTFLDTAGLTDAFEYYVIAVNPTGSSVASVAATAVQIQSSAQLPPTAQVAAANDAIVDSFDAGTSTTIRIYGPGGPSTSYSRYTSGNPSGVSRPFSTIVHRNYNANFCVVFDGVAHITLLGYPAALPDHYEFVGVVHTVSAGGGGGFSGGGGGGAGTGSAGSRMAGMVGF